jgi:hypothetical protein
LLTGLALYVTNRPKKSATVEIPLGGEGVAGVRMAAGQAAEAD